MNKTIRRSTTKKGVTAHHYGNQKAKIAKRTHDSTAHVPHRRLHVVYIDKYILHMHTETCTQKCAFLLVNYVYRKDFCMNKHYFVTFNLNVVEKSNNLCLDHKVFTLTFFLPIATASQRTKDQLINQKCYCSSMKQIFNYKIP